MIRHSSILFPVLMAVSFYMMLPGCSKEPEKTKWPKIELEGSQDKVLLRCNYLINVKGHTVGYVLLDAKHSLKDDEVYGTSFMTTQFNRGADTNVSLMDVHFVESPEGALKSMTVDSDDGGANATFAVVSGETLEVRVEDAESVEEKRVPWKPGTLGPLAIDLSLVKSMMQPGETRSLLGVEPVDLAVYKHTLTALDFEELEAFPGQSLLKIAVVSEGEQIAMEGELWVNEKGVTLRATYPQMGMEFLHVEDRMEVTGHQFTSAPSVADVDFNQITSIEVDGIYNQEAGRQRVSLSSTLTDLTDMFPNTLHQTVKKNGKNEVELELSDQPKDGAEEAEIPGDEYLAGSSLIETNHVGMQEQVDSLVGGLSGDMEKLKVLRKFVYDHLEEKNYSKAMATAVETYESGTGDCTEHACLLAAMARQTGLPTRLVVGLVAIPDGGLTRCHFHMWNEVYLQGHWVSTDATRPAEKTKWSRYIKIADSSLADGNSHEFLLAGMVLLGDLRIFSK